MVNWWTGMSIRVERKGPRVHTHDGKEDVTDMMQASQRRHATHSKQ